MTSRPAGCEFHGDRARQARRRASRHGALALAALAVPAVLFPLGLWGLHGNPRFGWLADVTRYPWQFWVVAVCGSVATGGGVADWLYHRSGRTTVGKREHRAHLAALAGGGIPLFGLMALASVSDRPERFLVAVLAVLILTVVLICHDEYVFHRRCGRFETLAHRLLTFGNGFAFLAWTHWVFVAGGGRG